MTISNPALLGFQIRHATLSDLDAICDLESACFPPGEAATRADLEGRLRQYPNHFWLLEKKGEIYSMVNGMVTDKSDLEDAMYHDATLHQEKGRWQMIFGVVTHPDSRRKGFAESLLCAVITQAELEGRTGIVLTCKANKTAYYERFGFKNEGVSDSTHGGAVWYQMRKILEQHRTKTV